MAEIYSRYFPAEIQLHSYENGTSLARKLDNWDMLERFFKKHRIDITKDEISPVLHQREGGACAMIEHMYAMLTNRV